MAVILVITWGIAFLGHQASGVKAISGHTWLFLILSGAALKEPVSPRGIIGALLITCGSVVMLVK